MGVSLLAWRLRLGEGAGVLPTEEMGRPGARRSWPGEASREKRREEGREQKPGAGRGLWKEDGKDQEGGAQTIRGGRTWGAWGVGPTAPAPRAPKGPSCPASVSGAFGKVSPPAFHWK